jgi:hypothetical protein
VVEYALIEVRFAASLVNAGDDECWGKGAGQVSARALAHRLALRTEPEREVLTTRCSVESIGTVKASNGL